MARLVCLIVCVAVGVELVLARSRIATPRLCDIKGAERKLCGWADFSKEECLNHGCCYETCVDCPSCFQSKSMQIQDCKVPPKQKEDCGYYGIPEHECLTKGCCYAPVNNPNDPWCFKSISQMGGISGSPNTPDPNVMSTSEPEISATVPAGSGSYSGYEYDEYSGSGNNVKRDLLNLLEERETEDNFFF